MKRIILVFACLSLFFINTIKSQWIEVASFENLSIRDVCFINSDKGFITGGTLNDPVVLKTHDGGITWDTIGEQINGYIFSINFINYTTGFITSSKNLDSWIYRTTDQGNTWEIVSDLTLSSYTVSFPTDSIGYAIQTLTEYALITKTIDRGSTWEVISTFKTEWGGLGVTDFQFLTEDTGYMAYESGVVYRTNDGGLSFEQVYLDFQYDLKSMFFLNIDTGYIVGKEKDCPILTDTCGVVLKTSNGGVDWVISSVPGRCFDVFFINPDTGFIASGYYILQTNNSGENWQISDGNFWYYMYSVHFPNSLVGYAVGNSGIYKLDIYVGLNSVRSENEKISIFPNPANNYLNISSQDKVFLDKITIYNQTGQIVMQIKPTNDVINVSMLRQGIYIIEAESSHWITRNKLIIQK